MSRGRLQARLTRLEQGTPEARRLGAEVLALVDEYLADGGDPAELLEMFGLAENAEEVKPA
ncbi:MULTISPECIES: hypothetical protein [Streptomyces]|uniref:Uncharacterized protein n=2 Tax=Streptomyces TaxID=1883 RepID=A0ABV9IR96_9ACTN